MAQDKRNGLPDEKEISYLVDSMQRMKGLLDPSILNPILEFLKDYAGLVKENRVLSNGLKEAAAEKEAEQKRHNKQLGLYGRAVKGLEAGLGKVDGLDERVKLLDGVYDLIMGIETKEMKRLREENESLHRENKELLKRFYSAEEILPEELTPVTTVEDPSKTGSPLAGIEFTPEDEATPNDKGTGIERPSLGEDLTSVLGSDAPSVHNLPKSTYDIMKTKKFTTTDAFYYVLMNVYNLIDEKRESPEGAAKHIAEKIDNFLKTWQFDEDINKKMNENGLNIGKEVIERYFKDIVLYLIKYTGESPSEESLNDVALNCCLSVVDMEKDGKLVDNMKTLKEKFARYVKEHHKELE